MVSFEILTQRLCDNEDTRIQRLRKPLLLLHVAIPALLEYCHKHTTFLCSLVVQSMLIIYTCFTVHTTDCIAGRARLGNYVTHNVTWYNSMASNVPPSRIATIRTFW